MFDNFPWLFAVFHALHRLLTPRHPPCALNNLTTYIQRSSQVAKNALWSNSLTTFSFRCKPLSHSPQHVVAAGKKRDLHLEFVLLCLLVKNLPLCKRQKLTGNNAQLFLPAHNRNDFRFNRRADAIYLYNYIVKDQNRGKLSHAAALPWWTETRPLPQLFSSGKRRCEWNLVPSHQLTGYWAIPVSKT